MFLSHWVYSCFSPWLYLEDSTFPLSENYGRESPAFAAVAPPLYTVGHRAAQAAESSPTQPCALFSFYGCILMGVRWRWGWSSGYPGCHTHVHPQSSRPSPCVLTSSVTFHSIFLRLNLENHQPARLTNGQAPGVLPAPPRSAWVSFPRVLWIWTWAFRLAQHFI